MLKSSVTVVVHVECERQCQCKRLSFLVRLRLTPGFLFQQLVRRRLTAYKMFSLCIHSKKTERVQSAQVVTRNTPPLSVSDYEKGCSSVRSGPCLRYDQTPDRNALESRVASTFPHRTLNILWSFLLSRPRQRACCASRICIPAGRETPICGVLSGFQH